MKIKLKTVLIIAGSLLCVLLPSCNTTAGLGRDVEHLGNHIEDTAQRSSH